MKSSVRASAWLAACLLLSAAGKTSAYWQGFLNDTFDGTTSDAWVFDGVANFEGEELLRIDTGNGNVRAEWDQSRIFFYGDPSIVQPSRLSRRLGRTLTDRDTFRVRATLYLSPGSIPDTTELYQIANIGLYNPAETGPDRGLCDLNVKDACDFVEFNYWINNAYGGPNVGAVVGSHITNLNHRYHTGTNYLQTAMGEDHWLPTGTNLYIELTYHGAATNFAARTARCVVYSGPERTNILAVNGVAMDYTTEAVPTNEGFTVTDVGFYNYVKDNWGDANGYGRGTMDDVTVEQYFAPGEFFPAPAQAPRPAAAWASEPGRTYCLQHCTSLAAGNWTTAAVLVASGETASWTNPAPAQGGYYRVLE